MQVVLNTFVPAFQNQTELVRTFDLRSLLFQIKRLHCALVTWHRCAALYHHLLFYQRNWICILTNILFRPLSMCI